MDPVPVIIGEFPEKQKEIANLCLQLLPDEYRAISLEAAGSQPLLGTGGPGHGPGKFMSRLADKVLSNTVYSIIDVLLLKASTILAFVLLVRSLPDRDIAAIGIATGYLIFVQYLDVGPIRVLLRDYPKLSADSRSRNELLTALFAFWGLQAIAMLVVTFLLIRWVLGPLKIDGLPLLYSAIVVDFVALTLHGWIKVIYFADFQQRVATLISLAVGVVRLCSYVLLFFVPSLETYSAILIVLALAGSAVWIIAFHRRYRFRPIWHSGSLGILRKSLADYGLWDHLNRVVIDTLFTIDLVILSWFADIREMSSYTVALRFASLLRLVPAQLNSALQIASAKAYDGEHRIQVINTMLKVNALVSILQFAIILVLGKWLMTVLFGASAAASALNYALILCGAVTIFNLAYPLIAIVNNYCSLSKGFLFVFLPGLFFGLAAYVTGGAAFGALGMAWCNVLAYFGLAIGLAFFVARFHPISIAWQVVTPAESELLRRVISRIRK